MAESLKDPSSVPERLLGRPFGAYGLGVVKEAIAEATPLNRAQIARRVCRALNWKNPGGEYQLMSARVGLLRLHRQGWIELPAPKTVNSNGRALKEREIELPEPKPLDVAVDRLEDLSIELVSNRHQSRLYNAIIEKYHYLGYTSMAGAQLRYLFRCKSQWLGAIGFGASAWKIAPRDQYIGWDSTTRERQLHLIINNARFLILPWVQSANLASKVLSLCARRLPQDFAQRYGYKPVLLETFVQRDRFEGICYRGANWVHLGQTQGRGKKHRRGQPGVPIKDIWVYPLKPNFRTILNQSRP